MNPLTILIWTLALAVTSFGIAALWLAWQERRESPAMSAVLVPSALAMFALAIYFATMKF